jgi:undecaprenyl-diphosphatase
MNSKKPQAVLLFSASIITAIIIKLLKEIVQAPRPVSTLVQETGYSFPSGHTTFAVVFFGLLIYIFTKTRFQKIISSIISVFIIAIIISTRLTLQVHYSLDIIAGAILGTSILIISILADKKLSKK